jgi:hypothetical protein
VERFKLERIKGNRNTINKKDGGPIDSNRKAALLIGFDACPDLLAFHVFFEAFHIEANL